MWKAWSFHLFMQVIFWGGGVFTSISGIFPSLFLTAAGFSRTMPTIIGRTISGPLSASICTVSCCARTNWSCLVSLQLLLSLLCNRLQWPPVSPITTRMRLSKENCLLWSPLVCAIIMTFFGWSPKISSGVCLLLPLLTKIPQIRRPTLEHFT